MKRLALLLVALLLLAPAVSAGEVWEKQLGEEITAVATDEYGDRIFVGTESGMLYCYDASGSVVWSRQVTTTGGNQPIGMIVAAGGEGVFLRTSGATNGRYELFDGETGAVIWGRGSTIASLDGDTSNTDVSVLCWGNVVDIKIPSGGSSGTTVTRLPFQATHGVIAGDADWFVITKPADSNLYLYSLNLPQDDWIAPVGEYGFEHRAAHTLTGTTAALTNYPVEITVIRGAGSSAGSTLYAPDCRADFADIRFTAADGKTQLPYYLESVNGNTAKFYVKIPSIPISPGKTTIYTYWEYPAGITSESDPAAQWIFYDDFEDGSINTSLWTVTTEGAGTVTETGGYLEIYASGVLADYAAVTGPTVTGPCQLIANVSFHEVPSYRERALIPWIDGGAVGVFSDVTSGGQQLYWAGYTGYSTTLDSNQLLHAWWTPGGDATYTYGSDWNVTRSPAASSVSISFSDGDAGAYYGGHTRIYDIGVTSYNSSAFFTRSWSSVESIVTPLGTETLTGTIVDIDAPETGDWVAVSTTTKTYIIQITDSGFGTTYSADRTGTPYQIQVAAGGSFAIEGRNILSDIFRIDGVQVGTYTTGGAVQHVAIAQKNGLYAAAGSDDGKYYVFSKDAASSWYLLHASDSYDPVTALAMSWRGELLIVGRADGRLSAFQVSEQEAAGSIRVTIFKDNVPYTNATLRIEDGGADQEWSAPISVTTDDYGVAAVPVQWGNYLRITIGDDELSRIIVANPTQTEYVLRIKGPTPLRTGAQYASSYDPNTQRIYLSYDDTREKTHRVVYQIVRAADNAVVFEREYTDADLPLSDYYQIPAGWTNTSYRVHLTASGSPSFTNTWNQWVGTDGVATLPGELDKFAKMGIAFFLILFVAGLFSYYTGPQGAVVVSLFTAALVLWGWLPLPPAVVALAIIWAFLGLLGRTSGEG